MVWEEFLHHADVQAQSGWMLLLGKQQKQNDAFCSCKLTEWTDMHEKNTTEECGTPQMNYLQLWCDYRRDGYFVKSCTMFSSFLNTYANQKVPITQYVNQLKNIKVTAGRPATAPCLATAHSALVRVASSFLSQQGWWILPRKQKKLPIISCPE